MPIMYKQPKGAIEYAEYKRVMKLPDDKFQDRKERCQERYGKIVDEFKEKICCLYQEFKGTDYAKHLVKCYPEILCSVVAQGVINEMKGGKENG